MIYPGLVSATFKEKESDEVIALCKRAGLSFIEWSEGHHVKLGETKEAERLAKCGPKVVALGSYYRLGENMEFDPVLDLAKALQAPVIRIWAGTKPSLEVDDSLFTALSREAESVGEQALKAGIQVAYEWHKKTLTDTNESALRLLSATPSCKTLWQPTVALSLEQRESGLKALGDKLVNLHVYYWQDSDGKRRPLSEGTEFWKRYLAQVSGDHYALLEFVMDNRVEQFLEDARTLQTLVR